MKKSILLFKANSLRGSFFYKQNKIFSVLSDPGCPYTFSFKNQVLQNVYMKIIGF